MDETLLSKGDLERFWSKVLTKGTGCWLWWRATANNYGHFSVSGKVRMAHRVSWELHNGPIPVGLLVLHECDNRGCVRPDHLFLGTHQDNTRDCYDKGRHPSARTRRLFFVDRT